MSGATSTDRHKPVNNNFRKSRWDPASGGGTVAADPKPQPPRPKFNSIPNPNPNPNSKPKASPRPGPSPKPNPSAGPSNHYLNHTLNHRNHPPPPAPAPAPPQPTYGFHMLERRTIALADGSVRTYHALPPDYQDFPAPPPQRMIFPPPVGQVPVRHHPQEYWNSLGLEHGKRKFDDEMYGRRHNHHPGGGEEASSSSFRAAKLMRPAAGQPVVTTKHSKVDSGELKKAFLQFVKAVNETSAQRRSFLEKGKQHGRLHCLACPADQRSSKDFADTHSLIMHSYNWDKTEYLMDHLGFHKALCALMGWNYSIPPDNSKAYQHLPAEEAAANQDDLILWPPVVIIHNTLTGKNKEGRMEGLGNKYMDTRIRDLGFSGGKSKSLYGREGHLGLTLVKFSGDKAGLNEATRLDDHFERENHGRRAWFRLQPLTIGGPEDEKNPHLVNSNERFWDKRIFYGYLGTSRDIEKVDLETRKKVTFESRREYKSS